MPFIFFAFVVLIITGIYLAELSWKAVLIYTLLAVVSLVTVVLLNLHIGICIGFVGFLDAILLLHVFKRDITI